MLFFMRAFKSLTAIMLLLSIPSLAAAAPYGGKVVSGAATISREGSSVTNINQKTPNSSINWQGFSIAGHETVNFNQPSASSMTLNRVVGNERSVIDGALNANGKVFLINSNGVLFGQGASVNVGGLVASTLDIGDDDFTAGRYEFNGRGGRVVNMGRIAVPDGGYVVMLGEQVTNNGVIVARQGTVSLNGADKVTLNFNGDSLVSVMLDKGAVSALVENKRAVYADGGQVILTAKAANDAVSSRVNNDGLIQAQTIGQLKGDIRLYAYGGAAGVDGVLDASAPKGDGGFIETSGDSVKIAGTAVITTAAPKGKAGTWLIDPVDFTIAKSGGDMTGQTLSNSLANGDITIESIKGKKGVNGDINVNDVIAWSSDYVLTLNAYHDININNAINVNGDGGLVLIFGNDYNILTPASFSGTVLSPVDGYPVAKQDTSGGVYGSINFGSSGGSLKIDEDYYVLIRTLEQMKAISSTSQDGRFALVNDLDLKSNGPFTGAVVTFLYRGGIFTGLGHTVNNLVINSASNYTGLFGRTNTNNTYGNAAGTEGKDTYLRDIGIINPTIAGTGYVGALVGFNQASIKNAYVRGGKVSGTGSNIGGLVGRSVGNSDYFTAAFTDVFSSADVTGSAKAGGLAGDISLYATLTSSFDSNAVKITSAHSTGKVVSPNVSTSVDINIGGLVGYMLTGVAISDSYASGAVIIEDKLKNHSGAGGLVGYMSSQTDSRIENSFATGNVDAQFFSGGLIGYINLMLVNDATFKLINSYALGDVTAQHPDPNRYYEGVGGLIGFVANGSDSYFDRVFAKGDVTVTAGQGKDADGTTPKGGLIRGVGGLIGNVSNSSSKKIEIRNAHADGNVYTADSFHNLEGTYASGFVGGLIGYIAEATLVNVYATGNVTGSNEVGGLIGIIAGEKGSTILNSYATGNVAGVDPSSGSIGGLIGNSLGANISDSYATGNVNGFVSVGGLIGSITNTAIKGSYSTGSASGTNRVGGLVGIIEPGLVGVLSSSITNSYSTGVATGQTDQGGLVGSIYETSTAYIANSYWNQESGAGYNGSPTTSENSRAVNAVDLDSEVGGYILNGQTYEGATGRRDQRIEAERVEAERIEAERIENERLEAIRLENERLENERLENERLEAIRIENERLENERQEAVRAEENRLAEVQEAIVRSENINSASSPTKGQVLQVSFQSPSRADPPRSSLSSSLVDANGISMTEPKFSEASFSADIRTVESGGFSLSRSENSVQEGADSGGISPSGSEDSAQEEDE
ncbi:MAG: filamentous hemagglutinin N-terminal domain-containing protein [Deltaproteobacteria bacterium]|jgi:filamentous hemagglutinin family protein|nr:filamentous hemagglutinin N-terminal domain-containing protein [Deltaproteobacteria bacterium]